MTIGLPPTGPLPAHHPVKICAAPLPERATRRISLRVRLLAGAVMAWGALIAPATMAQEAAQQTAPQAPQAAKPGAAEQTGAVATGTTAASATAATSPITLPAVEVSGSNEHSLPAPYAGGQIAKGGSLGLLGTRNVMDSPFSTTSYTEKLIEDQQGRTAADTLINDSSVRTSTGANGFDDTFMIRGFAVPATDVGMNGLYGLISSQRVPSQVIERIDLLLGPGALINGIAPGGSIGGGINIITKRAGDQPLTRLTTTYIGRKNFGVAADFSRRYGAQGQWGVRFNGMFRDGEMSIDNGNVRNGLASLGVDYRGERLRWSFDGIFQRDDTSNYRPQISLNSGLTAIPKAPSARSNWFPGTRLSQQDGTVATRLEYDVTKNVTVYGAIGYRNGWNNQTFPVNSQAVDVNGNFRYANSYYDSYSSTLSSTVGANTKFNTFGIGHTLNIGYSNFQQEAGYAYITSGTSVASNIYNPSPLPTITAARTAPRKSSFTTFNSVAVADTLSFWGDRILLTGGVRFQNVGVDSYSTTTGAKTSAYNADAVTPLGGIVIKPWHNVSLYGNYAQGLTRGQIVGVGYNNVGQVLAPYKSEQIEAGVRVDWGRVMTQVSVFQITRPSAVADANNNLTYDGAQRNRGLELSAYGEILHGLRGMASATFLKPELTNPTTASDRGHDAAGVPDTTFSGSLDWDVPGVPGFALNGRVIYTSGSYLNTANTQKFDGWTRVDFGARYSTKIYDKPVTFRANLENAFGENYWLTTGTYVTVGSPRTLILSAAFDL